MASPTRGRPSRGITMVPVLLRIPEQLYSQLEAYYQGVLSRPLVPGEWHRPSRNDVLLSLLAEALQPTRQQPAEAQRPSPPPRYDNGSTVLQASANESTPSAPPRQHKRRKDALTPEELQAIADERTQCLGLTIRDFAQRLYDKGIYRAKDGDKPAEAGWLHRQLVKAREAGLL